jgi:hypothetical protein
MVVVAAAPVLEARAIAERDRGNPRYAESTYNLALTIRGSAEELASCNLQAAEILLQQAITLLGQSMTAEQPPFTLSRPTDLQAKRLPVTMSNIRGERVVGSELTLIEAALQLAHALLRRAIIEAVRHDIARGFLLQYAVAHLLCGVQRLFQIAGIEDPLLLHVFSPYAGKAICLQLDPHPHLVGVHLAHLLAHLVELAENA